MSKPQLTEPVLRALRAAGIEPDPTGPPPAPPGQVRYHLAVEQTVLTGTAPPAVVVATLRELAAQLERTEQETQHG